MVKDSVEYARKCPNCQKHSTFHLAPSDELTSIMSPWPFSKWGLDLLGPFPLASGQVKHLIVAIDYFTKWIEAELLSTITATQARKFVWRNIFTRFGVPRDIISDGGTHFCNT